MLSQAQARAKRAVITEAWNVWSTSAIPATLRQEIEEVAKELALSTPTLVSELCESYVASRRLRRVPDSPHSAHIPGTVTPTEDKNDFPFPSETFKVWV